MQPDKPADKPPPENFSTTLADVRAAKAGDRPALERLLENLRPWIRRRAAQRIGVGAPPGFDVEDVVQETCKDLFLGLDGYQERPGESIRDWVARVIENNVRDLQRRAGAKKRGGGKQKTFRDVFSSTLSDPGIAAADPRPSAEARAHEVAALRDRALQALVPRYRHVLELREQGLSFEEITTRLGFKNTKTARNLHQRAMERLRELLVGLRPDES